MVERGILEIDVRAADGLRFGIASTIQKIMPDRANY